MKVTKFSIIWGQISNFWSVEVKCQILSDLSSNIRLRVIWCKTLNFGTFEMKFQNFSHLKSNIKLCAKSKNLDRDDSRDVNLPEKWVSRSSELIKEPRPSIFRSENYVGWNIFDLFLQVLTLSFHRLHSELLQPWSDEYFHFQFYFSIDKTRQFASRDFFLVETEPRK